MVTLTDSLGLRKPAGSDPFLRDDFLFNFEKMDDYPGLLRCTSTTRPSWTSSQGGMVIVETDTRKLVLWTGSAWVTLNILPKVAVFSSTPNVTMSPSTTYTQAMGSFTPPRPCNVLILGSCHVQATTGAGYNFLGGAPNIDGSPVNLNDGLVAGPTFGGDLVAPVIGWATGVSASSHTLTFACGTGPGSTSMILRNIALTVIYIDN